MGSHGFVRAPLYFVRRTAGGRGKLDTDGQSRLGPGAVTAAVAVGVHVPR